MKNLKKTLKKIKIRHLIILSFLLMFNAFAWFIYATEISSGVNAHVKSWKILFKTGENEVTNYIDIDVDDLYPGMTDYEDIVSVYNKSEVSASMSYEILSARILDAEYITYEGALENGDTPDETNLTSEQLVQKLQNDYPFTINMYITTTEMSAGVGESSYHVTVTWPFESGNDDLDTLWGDKAYRYNQANPDNPSIHMTIKIKAVQS